MGEVIEAEFGSPLHRLFEALGVPQLLTDPSFVSQFLEAFPSELMIGALVEEDSERMADFCEKTGREVVPAFVAVLRDRRSVEMLKAMFRHELVRREERKWQSR